MSSAMIFILLVGFASSALAGWDFSLGFDSRTTPPAVQLNAEAGYGHRLYGDPSGEHPFFGYVRPLAKAAVSTTLTGVAALEVYPVSFFGVSAGRSWNNRRDRLPGLDCGLSDCMEELNFTFFRSRLLGQYQRWLTSLTYERSFYEDNDETLPYGDGTNIVQLASQGEVGHRWEAILGYTFSAEWVTGILAWDFRAQVSAQANDYQVFFLRRNFEHWNVTAGVGRFGSSQYGVEPTAVLTATWIGQKKIGP